MPTAARKDDSAFRKATHIYIAALAFIAALIVVTHLLNDAIVRKLERTALVVNVAGRQRMLSQRIGMLAQDLARGVSDDQISALEEELAFRLTELEKAHRALSRGSAEMGISPAMSLEAAGIDPAELRRLDADLSWFLEQGRAFLALPLRARAGSAQLAKLLDAARSRLLEELEAGVARIQARSEKSIANLRRLMGATMAVMLATLAAEALLVFRPLFRRLKATQRDLFEAAMTDPLTGSLNRRSWMAAAGQEIRRARLREQSLAVLMLDIDRFKAINDTWGHAFGDASIMTLASIIRDTLRATDSLGRLGGDEFAVLLPGTNARDALLVAGKLLAQIEETRFEALNSGFRMTISIGVTELMPQDDTITAALDRADQALYAAKQAGRNRALAWTHGAVAAEAA